MKVMGDMVLTDFTSAISNSDFQSLAISKSFGTAVISVAAYTPMEFGEMRCFAWHRPHTLPPVSAPTDPQTSQAFVAGKNPLGRPASGTKP